MRGLALAAAIFGLGSAVYIAIREGPAILRHPLRRISPPTDLSRHSVGWRCFASQDRALAYFWRAVFVVSLVCLFAAGLWWMALQV